jgi:hypothetical protein
MSGCPVGTETALVLVFNKFSETATTQYGDYEDDGDFHEGSDIRKPPIVSKANGSRGCSEPP